VLHLERRQARLAAMQRLVMAFQDQSNHRRNAVDFNTFSLLNIGTDEVAHSAFLAWLLDAHKGHGQGNLFLKAFLAACRPPIDLALPERYHVQTEFSGAESRIDILIHRAGVFVLYIENKTVSPAMPDQHDREFRDLQRIGEMLGVPEDKRFAIYLTPRGRSAEGASAQRWWSIAYQELDRVLETLLPQVTHDKVRYLLSDWLVNLETFAGTWRRMMTEFSEESFLVAENWETVLSLIQAKARLDDELRSFFFSLEAELRKQTWWEQGWRFHTKQGIWITNDSWRDPQDRALLWLGALGFGARHVFGAASPPVFYTQISKRHDKLKQRLAQRHRALGYEVFEDKGYFLHQDIQKCATAREAFVRYPEIVTKQIVDLFTEYTQLMMDCEDIIAAYLEELA
jgi:hypothetical protein